ALECDQRAITIAPEPSRRMKQVEMRTIGAEPRTAMEETPCLEDRRVERFAVEADEAARFGHRARNGLEHRALLGKARHQKLARDEAVAVEPTAPDEERVRAGAAAQPRGFEIEEQERRADRMAAGQNRRIAGRGMKPGRQRSDFLATMPGGARPLALDDEAAVAMAAAQCRKIAPELGARGRALAAGGWGLGVKL